MPDHDAAGGYCRAEVTDELVQEILELVVVDGHPDPPECGSALCSKLQRTPVPTGCGHGVNEVESGQPSAAVGPGQGRYERPRFHR